MARHFFIYPVYNPNEEAFLNTYKSMVFEWKITVFLIFIKKIIKHKSLEWLVLGKKTFSMNSIHIYHK